MANSAGKHILYVAWGFAPHRGPGTYRPLATVNELARRGYRVTVLTTDLDTFDLVVGGDHALLTDLDPSVRLIRVPTPAQTRDPVLNRWSTDRGDDPAAWRSRTLENQLRLLPEASYAVWMPRILPTALSLHDADPVDLVIATGNPYVDFTVPMRLASEHGIPFVLDDRDSWLLDVYTGEEAPQAERIRPWIELALTTALQMWFVNPPLADWHRANFPDHADKIRVVENGWDPMFLDVSRIHAEPGQIDRPILSFVGTVNSTLPLRLLAEGWRLARRRSATLRRGQFRIIGHFGHAGIMTPEQARIRQEYADDDLVFTGRRPKHSISTAYAEADVLVFAKEGSGLVTSGKVYEYVATGLPIVSVVDPDHDARRVLAGYPRWFDAAADTPESLADAMIAALANATAAGTSASASAVEYGARFRRDRILAGAIDSVEQEAGW